MNKLATRRCYFRRAVMVLFTGVALFATAPAHAAEALPKLLIILDSSSSMEDQLASELKYKLVRRAMNKALPAFEGKLETGLITYGRNSSTSCKDIQRVSPFKPLKSKAHSLLLNYIKPRGKSPIGASLADAATMAQIATNPLDMLLIADGGDNCRADICATAGIIAKHSSQTKVHVIGLGKTGTIKKLSCISEATNGIFKAVGNRDEMTAAINQILSTIVSKEPEPVAQVETAPEEQTEAELALPPLPTRKPLHRVAKTGKIPAQVPEPVVVAKAEPEPTPAPESAREPAPAPHPVATPEITKTIEIPEPPKVAKAIPPTPAPEPMVPVAIVVTPEPQKQAIAEKQPAAPIVATPPVSIPATNFIGNKPSIEVTLPQTTAPVELAALITEEGKEIQSGLIWRIYNTKKDKEGSYKLVKTVKAAHFTETLPLGVYLVNLSWGRSHLTEKMDILSSKPFAHKYVLNAGGLRLGAHHMDGTVLPARQVIYRVYSDERDQFGKRRLIIDHAKPDKTIRLNAGIYHVSSLYGTANGLIETDITVEAGRLTHAIINHRASKVTFKLVNQPGGEALAGTIWRIQSPDGKLIKEAAGALPTIILAAGDYSIQAQYSGRTFARKVTIEPGDPVHVEIIIQ